MSFQVGRLPCWGALPYPHPSQVHRLHHSRALDAHAPSLPATPTLRHTYYVVHGAALCHRPLPFTLAGDSETPRNLAFQRPKWSTLALPSPPLPFPPPSVPPIPSSPSPRCHAHRPQGIGWPPWVMADAIIAGRGACSSLPRTGLLFYWSIGFWPGCCEWGGLDGQGSHKLDSIKAQKQLDKSPLSPFPTALALLPRVYTLCHPFAPVFRPSEGLDVTDRAPLRPCSAPLA